MTPHSPTGVQHVGGASCSHLQSNPWWWRHQVLPKYQ